MTDVSLPWLLAETAGEGRIFLENLARQRNQWCLKDAEEEAEPTTAEGHRIQDLKDQGRERARKALAKAYDQGLQVTEDVLVMLKSAGKAALAAFADIP